mmetsp:Transcript_67871/g.210839  ORF Transcript_67871/g.210839 Transcript_67871/m.210839 type:complete len:259 (-) Transcript_67871:523-1299(-)
MRSSPQNISRSSERLKALRHSKGKTSFRPARKASTCAETPASNQKCPARSTKSRTLSAVMGMLSPLGQTGAPLRPVSKKQAPTSDVYCSKDIGSWGAASEWSRAVRKRSRKSGRSACSRRKACTCSGEGSPPPGARAASPAASSAAKSARPPTSSPALPPPGRGRLAVPRGSPSTSAKNSSVSGRGTMKPSRNACPMSRPRKRKRRTASSCCGPSRSGRTRRPRRQIRCGEPVESSSSTHMGTRRFVARSWRACATST